MKLRSLTSAFALAAMLFAGNANAETLDAQEIKRLLEQPEMLDNNELSPDPVEQAKQVEAMIEVVFEPLEQRVPGIVDKVIDITDCESGLNHLWPDGTLKINPDPKSSAAGAMQILLITHRPDYQRVGLDPKNAPENFIFGRYMIERKLKQGRKNPYEDWVCA